MAGSETDLYFEHLKGQAQFAYFQLGLAASAIAFAVHETAESTLEETLWPIGAAVALWALSFGVGCFGITARQRGMRTNLRYLEAKRGVPPALDDPEIAKAMAEAKQITQNDLDRPMIRFRWQLYTLFGGALFYIGGHIMQMAARSYAVVT